MNSNKFTVDKLEKDNIIHKMNVASYIVHSFPYHNIVSYNE